MNQETLLLRQVHPKWIQQGRITSQVFKPTPKDKKKLSVYDGDMIGPENAWEHYTEKLDFESVGVMAVTVSECNKYDLQAKSDPTPFKEHAVIDFTEITENQIIKKSKRLKALAIIRGWLYQTEMSS